MEMDAEMTITLHIQTVDQAAAVKSIKAKVSDIDKMKVEEQKKAARSGYDMDILPPDLVTYSNDAKTLLEDLQSRNERMFLLKMCIRDRLLSGQGEYRGQAQAPARTDAGTGST